MSAALTAVADLSYAVIAAKMADVADPAAWRSTVLFTSASGSICTATVIGPRVALTAANCIGGTGTSVGILSHARIDDDVYELSCDQHPEFPKNVSVNFALCATPTPFANTSIEKVDTASSRLSVGREVVVSGYGCRLLGGVDRGVGELSIVTGIVTQLPSQVDVNASVSGAALCFGDAGGGTYVYTDTKRSARLLVGVNSKSNFKDQSWIALTSAPQFRTWVKSWSSARQLAICGVSAGQDGCRPETVQGPSPDVPSWAWTSAAATIAMIRLSSVVEMAAQSAVAIGASGEAGSSLTRLTKVAPRRGETLRALVNRVCGRVSSEYFKQSESYYRTLGLTLQADDPLPAGEEVAIAPCPKSTDKEVVVREGDTVWGYYLASPADGARTRWRAFQRPNQGAIGGRGEYFLDAFRDLNLGVNVDALEVGKTVRVPTSPSTGQDADPVIAIAPGAIQPIFALQSSEESCKSGSDSATYPYDINALLDALAMNRWLVRQPRFPVKVLMADSGLYGAGLSIFQEPPLVRTHPVWENYTNDIRPLTRGPEPGHGTAVASLLLGGSFFARFQALGEPRISLVVKRVYQKYASPNGEQWHGPVDQIYSVIKNAVHEHQAQVVNLSFKTSEETYALRDEFGYQSSALFVAAAGNFDGRIGPVSYSRVYPAVYGGADAPNLVVVAAANGDGELPAFSNYSPEFVDIAAPGCRVPVLTYDPEAREWSWNRLSGTSLAAPIVAFAAALTRSERPDGWTPVDLKRRLLVTADLRPELLPYVSDGRLLNLTKAVASFQDIVEAETPRRLIFGDLKFVQAGKELRDDDRLALRCNNEPTPVLIRDIFKIVPRFVNAHNETVTKVYYRAPRGLFLSTECVVPTDLLVLIHDTERDSEEHLALGQIRDIVRRWIPR